MLADIRPNEERAKAFVVSNHISMGVQAGPLMSEHEVGRESREATENDHNLVLTLLLVTLGLAQEVLHTCVVSSTWSTPICCSIMQPATLR